MQRPRKPTLYPVRPGLCKLEPQGLQDKCLHRIPSLKPASQFQQDLSRKLVRSLQILSSLSGAIQYVRKLLSHHALGICFHFIVSHCGLEVYKVTLYVSEPLFTIGKGVTTGAPKYCCKVHLYLFWSIVLWAIWELKLTYQVHLPRSNAEKEVWKYINKPCFTVSKKRFSNERKPK